MGIFIFVVSIGIAYYVGKYISKKYKSSNQAKKYASESDGDAAMPDAPWVGKDKKNNS